ncbi:hypothetical protein F5146DRAFT_1001525 [Armillaria mellea]|nr:hypothetical protein F5146DRAFT_1001525 [Armillaria mellea]
MKSFLVDDLVVSEECIQCLLSGSDDPTPDKSLTPSHENIIRVLYSLVDNQEIVPGDNILIYCAGYGASYSYARGRYVADISDRELDALFTGISRVKGYEITFITDCCYACSFPRTPDTEMRSIHHFTHSDVSDMLRPGHEKLEHFPGYQSISSEDWKPDRRSHLSLAACRDYQTARETLEGGGYDGIFTKILLRVWNPDDWKKETPLRWLPGSTNSIAFGISCKRSSVGLGTLTYSTLRLTLARELEVATTKPYASSQNRTVKTKVEVNTMVSEDT